MSEQEKSEIWRRYWDAVPENRREPKEETPTDANMAVWAPLDIWYTIDQTREQFVMEQRTASGASGSASRSPDPEGVADAASRSIFGHGH